MQQGDKVKVSAKFMREAGLPRWEGAIDTVEEVGEGERKGLVRVKWDRGEDAFAWWRRSSLQKVAAP